MDRQRVLGKPAPELACRRRRGHRPSRSRPHPAPADPPSDPVQWRIPSASHRSVGLAWRRGREGREDVGRLRFRGSRRLGRVSARTGSTRHFGGRWVAGRRTPVLRWHRWRISAARLPGALDAERPRGGLGLRSQAVCGARLGRLANTSRGDHRPIRAARQHRTGRASARPGRAGNQRSGMGLPRLGRRRDQAGSASRSDLRAHPVDAVHAEPGNTQARSALPATRR